MCVGVASHTTGNASATKVDFEFLCNVEFSFMTFVESWAGGWVTWNLLVRNKVFTFHCEWQLIKLIVLVLCSFGFKACCLVLAVIRCLKEILSIFIDEIVVGFFCV